MNVLNWGFTVVNGRAGTNTPSDEYDSYREYRVANTNMYSRIHINLIKTIIEMNEFTIFYQHQL